MDDPKKSTTDTLRLIARDEIGKALITHLSLCPLAGEDVSHRLRTLEISHARLIGYMVGIGLISGATATLAGKLVPGL